MSGSLPSIAISPSEGEAHGQKMFAVAQEICAPNPAYAAPITLDCSLACTAINWPMQMGILTLRFFKDDPLCPAAGTSPSNYIPNLITIGLGCRPGTPVVDGIWQAQFFSSTTLILGPPAYGMSFRFRAVMTVNLDASVSLTVDVDRLVPNSEFSPSPPGGENVYVSCGNFSTTLTRNLGGNPSLPRNTTWTMDRATLIPYSSSNQYCDNDIKSVAATIQLIPYRVGCDGTATGGTRADCSLDTGSRTYSCMAALVKPTTPGTFQPQWVQMGVNRSALEGYGCFEGHNSGTGLSPPVSASLTPSPIYPPLSEILNCGCANEDPILSDKQQIQFATVAGYDVVLKSVNGASPCLAIRQYGAGNPWTVGSYTIDSTILSQTGHWVIRCSFPSIAGQPIVILYGLQFPSGITANCVDGVSMPQPATQTFSHPTAREIVKKMNDVKEKKCIHLGMALETTPSCGCAGGILHECAIHKVCRVSGSTMEMNCWRCPDYIDQQS